MYLKERYAMEENINNLNQFLCELEIMSVKLQNYHWNVQGKHFFVIHSKLEEYYDEIREQIDEIAEHILAKGFQPLGTMNDFIQNSKIQEAKNEKIESAEILTNIIEDYKTLQHKAIEIKQEAEKVEDYETSALIDDYLKVYAKKLWMFNESIK